MGVLQHNSIGSILNQSDWEGVSTHLIGGVASTNIVRSTSYVVAANDAPQHVRAQADYVCDGTADDVEIQAAITALPTNGGTVHLSQGTFNIATNLLVKSYTILEGEGDTTVIVQNVAANYDPINSGNYPASGNGDYTVLRNFKLDGKRATVTGSGTIVWYGGTHPIFENLHLVDMYGTGILLRTCTRALIKNNHIDNAKADGIAIYDGSNLCIISGNIVENCDGSYGIQVLGIEVAGQAETASCIIANNISRANVNGIGIVAGAVRNLICANYCANNSASGILTYGLSVGGVERQVTDALIIGNYSSYNVDGIRIDGVAAYTDDAMVVGNHTDDNTTGINITAQGRTTVVKANHLRGDTTSLTNSGSSSKINQNTGYISENSSTATVANGATTAVVSHGLATTPTRVLISLTNNPTNDPQVWWVSTLTTTQFTINTKVDPGATGAIFDWRAQVGEG